MYHIHRHVIWYCYHMIHEVTEPCLCLRDPNLWYFLWETDILFHEKTVHTLKIKSCNGILTEENKKKKPTKTNYTNMNMGCPLLIGLEEYFNIKMCFNQYRNSQFKNKMAIRCPLCNFQEWLCGISTCKLILNCGTQLQVQGSFCLCAQPMRDGVTF